MVMARAAGVLLALVACAWFALGVLEAHDESKVAAIVSLQSSLSAAQAAHADSMLSTAGTLNPDLQIDLLRGQVAALADHQSLAARIFHDVVRQEPMNLQGWVWLAATTGNVHLRDEAIHAIGTLDPKVTPRR